MHSIHSSRTNETIMVEKRFKPYFEASVQLRDRINEEIMQT